MTDPADTPRSPGQPKKGRTKNLCRISERHHAMLTEMAASRDEYLPDTLERLIEAAHAKAVKTKAK